ncbi:hypothetical protein V6B33_11295 [Mangrovibacillus sp. Mu-81]|uniref:hypothetical protein n=1 Tax=Mangrovibacillus sp. Mu-81 TaxID=3121478 RepID=UPI002FE4B4CC
MYRPTVRYSEVYREYVDQVFHATSLDRNQIIRLALFIAGSSPEYNAILNEYKKADVPLPRPKWRPNQSALWLEQDPELKEEGGDVTYAIDGGKADTRPVIVAGGGGSAGTSAEAGKNTRSPGPLREGIIRTTGGISFTLN